MENLLRRMGLSMLAVRSCAKNLQLLNDLVERWRVTIAQFHPDKNAGLVSGEDFSNLFSPFKEWRELSDEQQMAQRDEFLTPPPQGDAAIQRFLQARAETTEELRADDLEHRVRLVQTEADKLVAEAQAEAHAANQAQWDLERQLGEAQTKLKFYNPERNLEVSGLTQLIRTLALNGRDMGGSVNRYNRRCFFGSTSFTRSTLKVEEKKVAVEGVPGGVVEKVVKKGAVDKDSPRLVKSFSTSMFYVREDTALMRCRIVRSKGNPRDYWKSDAAAIDSLKDTIAELKRRASMNDFTAMKTGNNVDTWECIGHIVGLLDPVVPVKKEASQPDGSAMTVSGLIRTLQYDLSRVLPPNNSNLTNRGLVLLTIQPVLTKLESSEGDDVGIKYLYRQVRIQASLFDPMPML